MGRKFFEECKYLMTTLYNKFKSWNLVNKSKLFPKVKLNEYGFVTFSNGVRFKVDTKPKVNTDVAWWLHCVEFGILINYPNDKALYKVFADRENENIALAELETGKSAEELFKDWKLTYVK